MVCRVKGLSVRKVAGFCGISTASVVRISKGNSSTPSFARSSAKRGNKFKLSERQRRHLIILAVPGSYEKETDILPVKD